MSHPLEEKVAAIGRTARMLLLFYGVACMLAGVVLTAFVLGLADYLLRVEDTGVRLICSAMLAACGVGGFWLLVRPAWPVGRSLLQVAQQIETRFPELRDRLSSTLQFLQQDQNDPTAGSAELRRSVVAETTSFVERLPLAETLNVKRPLGIGAAALGLCLLLLSICAIDAPGAGLAFHRLLVPWSAPAWPQQHKLEFVDPPAVLAAGDDFVVTVRDIAGEMPADVQIHYEFEGKSGEVITEAMQPVASSDQSLMTARLNNVARNFRYRATGGDDQNMPWLRLQVAEPPHLQDLTIRVIPPAYTRMPESVASNGHLQAIAGSKIEISGASDKPLKSLAVVFQRDAKTEKFPLSIDGQKFAIKQDAKKPWVVTESGVYWLEATSKGGVATGSQQRWQVRVKADQPPQVSLDKPASTLFVTAGSMIPLEAKVSDDLALQSIQLEYAVQEEDATPASLQLWQPAPAETSEDKAATDAVKSHTINYKWDLAKLPTLEPGQRLRFFVSASDFLPQTGRSTQRDVAIISRAELEDRLAQRQGYLLTQLAAALAKQEETRTQTRSLEIQMNDVGKIGADDVDQLQSAELNQRQVQRQLNLDEDSIENQASQLLDDLENNRIDNPDSRRRMQALLEAVKNLGEDELPGISRKLTAAMKTARVSAQNAAQKDPPGPKPDTTDPSTTTSPAARFPVSEETKEAVAEAGAKQDQTVEKLKALVESLSKWDNYRRISREVNQIRRDQEKVAAATSSKRPEVEGKTSADLTAQQRADLKKIAQQQLELARKFDKLQNRMDEMQQQLSGADPLAAETIADALDAARRSGLSAQMQQSGRQLNENRLGQSAQTQQKIDQKLQDVLDVLANRREHELDRTLRKLKEAASQLDQVQNQQRSLRKQMAAAGKIENEEQRKRELQRLAAAQKQLAEQARRLSRQLERLQAPDASNAMQQAANSMDAAASQAEQGNGDDAGEEQDKSELELENAAQEIKQKQEQTEKDLFEEQMTRLKQSLEGMVQRQEAVIQETIRLQSLGEERTRAQRASIASLAVQQRGLAAETLDFAQQVAQAKAFELALRGAAREMTRAASQLDRGDTGEETRQAETVALDRLKQLLVALNPPEDQEQPPQNQQPSGGGGSGGEQSGQSDSISRIAQLNLLKLLQQEINRRTTALEAARDEAGELTPVQQQEQDALAVEQGELAELLLELSKPPAGNPEDDPDSLPTPGDETIPGLEDLDKDVEDLLKDADIDLAPTAGPSSDGDSPPEP